MTTDVKQEDVVDDDKGTSEVSNESSVASVSSEANDISGEEKVDQLNVKLERSKIRNNYSQAFAAIMVGVASFFGASFLKSEEKLGGLNDTFQVLGDFIPKIDIKSTTTLIICQNGEPTGLFRTPFNFANVGKFPVRYRLLKVTSTPVIVGGTETEVEVTNQSDMHGLLTSGEVKRNAVLFRLKDDVKITSVTVNFYYEIYRPEYMASYAKKTLSEIIDLDDLKQSEKNALGMERLLEMKYTYPISVDHSFEPGASVCPGRQS